MPEITAGLSPESFTSWFLYYFHRNTFKTLISKSLALAPKSLALKPKSLALKPKSLVNFKDQGLVSRTSV